MEKKQFEFDVTTPSGQKQTHSLVGFKDDVLQFCAKNNVFLTALRQTDLPELPPPKKQKTPSSPHNTSPSSSSRKKKIKQPIVFFKFIQMLSRLLNKHLTLTQAFRTMMETTQGSKKLSLTISHVQNQISQGLSLYEAVDHSFYVDKSFIGLIRVGEETGTLKKVLSDLSNSLEKKQNFKKSLQSTLIYPIILVVTSLISILILFLFVIPRFIELFNDLNQKIPWITRIVFNFSQFIQNYFFFLLFGFIGSVCLLYFLSYFRKVRLFYEYLLFFNPICGSFFRKNVTQSQCHSLAIMLKSGLLLPHSFKLLIPPQKFFICQNEILHLLSGVEQGQKLSSLIQSSRFYPSLLAYFVSIGEENGELGQSFDDLAQIYEEEISSFLKNFMALLSPLIIVFMGGFIATVILSVVIPSLSLTNIQA